MNQARDPEQFDNAESVRRHHGNISNMTLHRWINDLGFPKPDRVINGRRYWKHGNHAAWEPPARAMKPTQRPPTDTGSGDRKTAG